MFPILDIIYFTSAPLCFILTIVLVVKCFKINMTLGNVILAIIFSLMPMVNTMLCIVYGVAVVAHYYHYSEISKFFDKVVIKASK